MIETLWGYILAMLGTVVTHVGNLKGTRNFEIVLWCVGDMLGYGTNYEYVKVKWGLCKKWNILILCPTFNI